MRDEQDGRIVHLVLREVQHVEHHKEHGVEGHRIAVKLGDTTLSRVCVYEHHEIEHKRSDTDDVEHTEEQEILEHALDGDDVEANLWYLLKEEK